MCIQIDIFPLCVERVCVCFIELFLSDSLVLFIAQFVRTRDDSIKKWAYYCHCATWTYTFFFLSSKYTIKTLKSKHIHTHIDSSSIGENWREETSTLETVTKIAKYDCYNVIWWWLVVSTRFQYLFHIHAHCVMSVWRMDIHVKTANKHAINLQRCMFACDDKLNTVHIVHIEQYRMEHRTSNDLRLLLM